MNTENNSRQNQKPKFASGKQIIINSLIIAIIAVLGVWIVYFSLAVFTKHGEKKEVPSVERLTYTQAIEKLHDAGFRTEIRDSLYREDVRPGMVIEQFPKGGAVAKPGRKIFLYINAVNPKHVVIDNSFGAGSDALRGLTLRSGLAHLEELGFKNIQVVKVLGENENIVKILANGKPVKKHEKIPVNAKIIVEVYDGRLGSLRDSLLNEETGGSGRTFFQSTDFDEASGEYVEPEYSAPDVRQTQPSEPEPEQDEEPTFIE